MSFSNLRPGSPIYILNKTDIPTLEIGTIVSVSSPVPKIIPMQPYGAPQIMTVDLTVKVGEQTGSFPKVNAHADYEEYENNGVKTPYVLATSRDGINSEINSICQQAQTVINSVEHNKKVVAACQDIYARINPELAEKQKQEQEIADLKKQLASQGAQMAELIALLKGKEPESKEERSNKNK